MPSRKFQSGLARTLANALFQQYAQEDASKAQESDRAFTTSRDMARQLFDEKRAIRSDMEAKNNVLEGARLKDNAQFRSDQREEAGREKQREFDKWKAELSAKTQMGVAKQYRPDKPKSDNLNEKALWEELANLSTIYMESVSAKNKDNAKAAKQQYNNTKKVLEQMGQGVPELTDFIFEESGFGDSDVPEDEPGWLSQILDFATSKEVYDPSKAPGFGLGQQVRGMFGGGQEQQQQQVGPQPQQQQQSQYQEGDILQFDDGTMGIVRGGQVFPISEQELQQMLTQ